jgi:hypothetical protein
MVVSIPGTFYNEADDQTNFSDPFYLYPWRLQRFHPFPNPDSNTYIHTYTHPYANRNQHAYPHANQHSHTRTANANTHVDQKRTG